MRNEPSVSTTPLSAPGPPSLGSARVRMASTTLPQLPQLNVESSLEFWAEDPVIGPTMEGRGQVQRSDGGEEVRIEEMPRRGEGSGQLLGHYEDGTLFFDPI